MAADEIVASYVPPLGGVTDLIVPVIVPERFDRLETNETLPLASVLPLEVPETKPLHWTETVTPETGVPARFFTTMVATAAPPEEVVDLVSE